MIHELESISSISVDFTMKSCLIVLLSVFMMFTSCNSTIESKEDKKKEKNITLEINFYSSSGGSLIYTIFLSNNVLIINNLNFKKYNYKKFLSKNDIKKLNKLLLNLKQRKNIESEIILDSWRIELIFNNITYYNESDVKLETLPEDIKAIVDFFVRGSTVKIDLYGFS